MRAYETGLQIDPKSKVLLKGRDEVTDIWRGGLSRHSDVLEYFRLRNVDFSIAGPVRAPAPFGLLDQGEFADN